jgi:hypothetical protein
MLGFNTWLTRRKTHGKEPLSLRNPKGSRGEGGKRPSFRCGSSHRFHQSFPRATPLLQQRLGGYGPTSAAHDRPARVQHCGTTEAVGQHPRYGCVLCIVIIAAVVGPHFFATITITAIVIEFQGQTSLYLDLLNPRNLLSAVPLSRRFKTDTGYHYINPPHSQSLDSFCFSNGFSCIALLCRCSQHPNAAAGFDRRRRLFPSAACLYRLFVNVRPPRPHSVRSRLQPPGFEGQVPARVLRP